MDILPGWDVIVDGTDNFPTRFLVNDASVKLGIPVVHGSIFRFEGMVTVFDPKRGPTYRDMVPEPPPAEMAPSCAEAGVLGVLPGIVGSIQAIETIKLLLDLGDPLIGRLLAYDSLEQSFREYKVRVDPTNEITYANRDRIVVAELDDLCMPHPLQPRRRADRVRFRLRPVREDGGSWPTAPPRAAGAKAASGVVGLVVGARRDRLRRSHAAARPRRDRRRAGAGSARLAGRWRSSLAAVGMVAIALPWRRALRLLGGDLPIGQLVARYFVGEIGKYVPGGVWPILGRGELARRHGVRRAAAYGSVALSLVALYLAAMFVVVRRAPRAAVRGRRHRARSRCVLLLPVGLVALHPRVLACGAPLRRAGHPPPRRPRAARRGGSRSPSWASTCPRGSPSAAATWAVARALDPGGRPLEVGAAAVLSWVVGFVLVRCPAASACARRRSSPPPGRSTRGSPRPPPWRPAALFVVGRRAGRGARHRWRSAVAREVDQPEWTDDTE